VAFLDSDDIWKPWKIELQLAAFRAAPKIGMVWTDMEAIDPDGVVLSTAYLRTIYSAYKWFSSDDLFSASYPLERIAPTLSETFHDKSLYVGEIFSQMVMGVSNGRK